MTPEKPRHDGEWVSVKRADLNTVLMLAWDGHPSHSSIKAIRRLEALAATAALRIETLAEQYDGIINAALHEWCNDRQIEAASSPPQPGEAGMTIELEMECPTCNGSRFVKYPSIRADAVEGFEKFPCSDCGCSGIVPTEDGQKILDFVLSRLSLNIGTR